MKQFFYALLLLIISGCEDMSTIIDLDLPEHASLLVVYSTPISGEETKIYVSYSFDPLSNQDYEYLSDALVILKHHEQIDTAQFINQDSIPPYYVSSALIQGQTYLLEVQHSNHPTTFSELKVPYSTPIIDCSISLDSVYQDRTPVSFTFIDPPEPNYYLLRCKVKTSNSHKWKEPRFESADPSFDTRGVVGDNYFEGKKIYFTDQLFNDSEKIIDLDLLMDYSIDSVQIRLYTISESFYSYHISRRNQANHENNPLTELLGSEPVVVYNNIENGYGVFGVKVKNYLTIGVDY